MSVHTLSLKLINLFDQFAGVTPEPSVYVFVYRGEREALILFMRR